MTRLVRGFVTPDNLLKTARSLGLNLLTLGLRKNTSREMSTANRIMDTIVCATIRLVISQKLFVLDPIFFSLQPAVVSRQSSVSSQQSSIIKVPTTENWRLSAELILYRQIGILPPILQHLFEETGRVFDFYILDLISIRYRYQPGLNEAAIGLNIKWLITCQYFAV